jgi:hypothetical protein
MRRRAESPVLIAGEFPIPVSLAHFAAIGGQSEREYVDRMLDRIRNGDVLSILKPAAQLDFVSWLTDVSGKFVVRFTLSLNRVTNVALYCVCHKEESSPEGVPRWTVQHTIPGICDPLPPEAEGLPVFEVYFCDMRYDLE